MENFQIGDVVCLVFDKGGQREKFSPFSIYVSILSIQFALLFRHCQ